VSDTDVPELIRRAGALLARETSARAPLDPLGHRGAAPSSIPSETALPLDDLRRRALALVSDLFESLDGRVRPAEGGGDRQSEAAAPAIRRASPPAPVAAGRVASLPLAAENPSAMPVAVSFYSTDLLGDSGWTIPGHLVSFDPPRLLLASGQRAVVTARIDVPVQTAPGAYAGLVQVTGLPSQRVVLSIEVM
jgi:hypothetical protein